MRALLLLGIIICVIAVHPSCGHAQTPDERHAKFLVLRSINFLNTTKTGGPISGATTSFDVAKVLFVEWEVIFENRSYKLKAGQYRVDATYKGPDGRTLGSVDDFETVLPSMKTVTFSGRVGNSNGGAFLPGTYTVDFLLNGETLAEKQFRVVADAGGSSATNPDGESASGGSMSSGGSAASSGGDSTLAPTIATGTISGLLGGGTTEMELRLRPQPNGFLNGELDIQLSGFGPAPITGFIRETLLNFSVRYVVETYYFEGHLRSDQISGVFESQPTGERGTWNAQTN
jgi:hypothetical protein